MQKKTIDLIKITNINSLVISGGGMKGYLYLGAIKLLFEYKIIDDIKYYYGTSFGGIIVSCLSLGWNFEEINKLSVNFPIDCIVEYDIDNLINNYGLVPQKNYETFIKKLIIFKGFDENITFKELYNKTSKELHLITFSLKKNDTIDLNFETTPNLKLWEGIYMTSALPILVSPFNYENDLFIDGGILENFPLTRVKQENKNKMIGICSDSHKICSSIVDKNFCKRDLINGIEYSIELVKIIFSRVNDYGFKNKIVLNFDEKMDLTQSFNFKLGMPEKVKLIKYGYDETCKQIGDLIENIFNDQICENNLIKQKNKNFQKYNET